MVKTISECNSKEFEKKVNELIKEGYKITSSSCGYIGEVGNSAYDSEYWMAILVKE